MNSRSRSTGALLGLAGGVAGLVAMRYVAKGTRRLLRAEELDGARRRTLGPIADQRRQGEDATIAIGRSLFTRVMRREPGGREKQMMGHAIHWGWGLALATGYGLLRGEETRPLADLAGGALFGIGLWGVGEELLIPLLGLGDRPDAVPLKQHAQSLAGHIGYGVVTAATAQGLRRLVETLEERRERGEGLLPSPSGADLRERLTARFHR